MAAALLAAVVFSFSLGRYPISPAELFGIVCSKVFPIEPYWVPNMETILFNVRLPRILLSCMVGCSLSAAGAAYQGIFQNPMASPDILGATKGSAFGASLAIIAGMGTCPIAPPTRDELRAMDRVNTALLYGAGVRYLVDCTDAEIEAVMDQLPFNASRRYGEAFIDIFEEGKRDFYIVDKDIHTIASYEFTNIATGNTFRAGMIREDMLEQSFFH